jgi:hypothetical protein
MAYTDKIIILRRMALIRPKHNIVWAGVNINGVCLLKKVGCYGNETLLIPESQLQDFCEEDIDYPLEIKYQDKETDDYWEPRINKVHNVPKIKKELGLE